MPAPAPPEVVDAALIARADGDSFRDIARNIGCSPAAVHGWAKKLQERLDGWQTRIRSRWARNVLNGADAVSGALVTAASDPTLRHGPQAARVLLEGAGIIGGVRDLTINGDVVDASTNVTVDARRVQLIQGSRGAELDAHIAELSKGLGLDL